MWKSQLEAASCITGSGAVGVICNTKHLASLNT